MLYLKNTLGGLSRSLHDSAMQSFKGPNRWWKLALYVVMFVMPGGSLGVLFFAWVEHRRNGRKAKRGSAASAAPVAALLAGPGAGRILTPGAATAPGLPTASCLTRADAPVCRAAAGKQARLANADLRA